MNIEEAIKTAIDYEERVTDVYQKYAEKFESEIGKKIFTTLGKEEEDHVTYLKAKQAELEKSGTISFDKVDSVIPDPKILKANIKNLKKIARQPNIDDEVKYFQKALDMEIETSNFYKDMVSQLPSEFQPIFQRFVEIEEGHEAIVKAEIDNARGMGFWFDFQEFNLEAG